MRAKLEPPAEAEPNAKQPLEEPFPYGDRIAIPRDASRSASRFAPRIGSTACPSCGEETINGAGLFACTDCEWYGSLD